jgi:hypothetical protein
MSIGRRVVDTSTIRGADYAYAEYGGIGRHPFR